MAAIEKQALVRSGNRPRARLRIKAPTAPTMARIAFVVGLIVIWDLVGRLGLVDRLFVSSPLGVIGAIPDLLGSAAVRTAIVVTGTAIGEAFLIGTTLGIVVGLALGLSTILRQSFFGTILFFMGIPKAIFIPIFLLLFGISRTAVLFGAFEAFFYVTVNVVGGVGLVSRQHLTVAHAYGAGPWQRFWDVILPAAMPGLFAGLWYGIRHAFGGVLIAELYVSVGGLGQIITTYSNLLKTDLVIALTMGTAIAAIVVGSTWNRMEGRLSKWRSETRQQSA